MNSTAKRAIEMATTLGRRGFSVPGIEVHTPDGRTWAIDTTGPSGFRLFEIDPDGRRGPDEHDAVDGDTWHASDLVDYLDAVGQPKDPTGWGRPSGPTPPTGPS